MYAVDAVVGGNYLFKHLVCLVRLPKEDREGLAKIALWVPRAALRTYSPLKHILVKESVFLC